MVETVLQRREQRIVAGIGTVIGYWHRSVVCALYCIRKGKNTSALCISSRGAACRSALTRNKYTGVRFTARPKMRCLITQIAKREEPVASELTFKVHVPLANICRL